jgi:hypothetical protein
MLRLRGPAASRGPSSRRIGPVHMPPLALSAVGFLESDSSEMSLCMLYHKIRLGSLNTLYTYLKCLKP